MTASASKTKVRAVPCHVDVEKAVLGNLLTDPRLWFDVRDRPDDLMFSERHRVILSAIRAVAEHHGGTYDAALVANHLHARKQLEAAGGTMYLAELVEDVGTSATLPHHLALLTDAWRRRRVFDAATKVQQLALDADLDVSDCESGAIKAMLDATEHKAKRGLRALRDVVSSVVDIVEKNLDGKCTSHIPTPWDSLNKLVTLGAGDLIIVAGRPAMGKSSFMWQVATHAEQYGASLLYALEMIGEQIVGRRFAQVLGVPSREILHAPLPRHHLGAFMAEAAALAEKNVHIDDEPDRAVADILADVHRARARQGKISLIAIDYLQLLRPASGTLSRSQHESLGEITRTLKAAAVEFQCPILLGSQLNRSLESRTDKRPLLSDLRASGSIEEDASTVIGLYREDAYRSHGEPRDGSAEFIVLKQRNGDTGTVAMRWQSAMTCFTDPMPAPRAPAPAWTRTTAQPGPRDHLQVIEGGRRDEW